MNRKKFSTNILVAIPALFFAAIAGATPVTGIANIAGNVTVSGTSISFSPSFTSTTGALETGSFTGLTGGTISSLTGGPVTGATFVPDFITFSTGVAAPVIFDLTYISPGVGTNAGCLSSTPGATCTPPGSPFSLFQLSSNTVVATIQFNGQSYIGSAATGTSFTSAIFSTQTIVAGTVPMIYNMLATGQSISGITYSASFATVPTIPEPATGALLGAGLALAGIVARRSMKAKK